MLVGSKGVLPVRLDAPRSIHPDFHIRKTRAYALPASAKGLLKQSLSHPRFAHLEVGC